MTIDWKHEHLEDTSLVTRWKTGYLALLIAGIELDRRYDESISSRQSELMTFGSCIGRSAVRRHIRRGARGTVASMAQRITEARSQSADYGMPDISILVCNRYPLSEKDLQEIAKSFQERFYAQEQSTSWATLHLEEIEQASFHKSLNKLLYNHNHGYSNRMLLKAVKAREQELETVVPSVCVQLVHKENDKDTVEIGNQLRKHGFQLNSLSLQAAKYIIADIFVQESFESQKICMPLYHPEPPVRESTRALASSRLDQLQQATMNLEQIEEHERMTRELERLEQLRDDGMTVSQIQIIEPRFVPRPVGAPVPEKVPPKHFLAQLVKRTSIKDQLKQTGNNMYKLRPGCKYTYQLHCTVYQYISALSAQEQYAMLVFDWSRKVDCYLTSYGCNYLEQHRPNIDLIELEDQIYQISTGKFLPFSSIPLGVHCARAFPVTSTQMCTVEPKHWLHILENSGYVDEKLEEFLIAYGRLFHRKRLKERNMTLVGPTQCGKSSLLDPLSEIFGDNRICRVSQSNNFGWERMPGSRVIVMEEFRAEKVLTQMLLQVLEGRRVQVDVKYGKNVELQVTQPCVLVSNFPVRIDGDNSGALEQRLQVFQFNKLPGAQLGMNELIEKEAPYVLFRANRAYLNAKQEQ